jgi:predicted dehydrogenase
MINLMLSFTGWSLLKSARVFFRLPDWLIITSFSTIEFFLRLTDKEHPGLLAVRDFKNVIRNFPEGNRIVRRFFIDCRQQQAIDLFKGAIKHNLFSEKHPFSQYSLDVLNERLGKGITIGFVGSDYDFELLKEAYREDYQCQITQIDPANPGDLTEVNGLEAATIDSDVLELLKTAVKKGVAISIHHSAIPSVAALQKILVIIKNSKKGFRILYPYSYYPPVKKIKNLIDKGEIGEVATIRIRATIGRLEELPYENQIQENTYLNHPAFDHFRLLTLLGGEIEKVSAYLNPMKAITGGQGLINCKYKAPGSYGILECSYAPEMSFITEHHPYNLEAEIAGSDGIIWLQRGMATRTRSAPVSVRVGPKAYTIGVESGFPSDWGMVYHNMAGEFLDMIRHPQPSFKEAKVWLNAHAVRDLAYTANNTKKAVGI